MQPQSTTSLEEWRPVCEFEGWYEVSDLGRVRRIAPNPHGGMSFPERILRPCQSQNGYLAVSLSCGRDGRTQRLLIHRMVLAAFTGPFAPDEQSNHINGVKADNRRCNLEKVSRRENIRHSWVNGLQPPGYGRRYPNAKLTEDIVREIRRLAPQFSQVDLAKRFKVSQPLVSRVISRHLWAHV